MIRARAKMPEVDDERAEVIAFGLNILIGEKSFNKNLKFFFLNPTAT